MDTFRRILLPCCLLVALHGVTMAAENDRPNVLFIAVDDLRPELACYGAEQIHSPNIDRLASQSMRFERAYCMVPTCGASRASLMTSVRPARNRFVGYRAWAERDAPNARAMNVHFHENGYYTVSLGKVYHNLKDHSEGWSEPAWRPDRTPHYLDPKNQKIQEERRRKKDSPGRARGPAYESADVPDTAYGDGKLARRAVKTLGELKKRDEPFFLAVGFFKPHLPFVAPKKYWDLYDPDKIHMPENEDIPKNAPPEAIHGNGELHAYAGIPEPRVVPEKIALELRHGYYACVSYTDAQVGKVLDELDRLDLADDTIVVLWGDHGWSLGAHTLWHKHSCFELAMRIPLLVRVPGSDGGQSSPRLIETIDIYPTLCELAGLPRPDHLQGRSFVPLLNDPHGDWKTAAVGRYGNGDTIRTDTHRFTEYTRRNGKTTGTMLYNHESDPGETVNIAEDKPSIASRLTKSLHEQMGRDKTRKKSEKD